MTTLVATDLDRTLIYSMAAIEATISGTVPPLVLERATDSLAHRGPDDRGTVVLQANTAPRLEIGLGPLRAPVNSYHRGFDLLRKPGSVNDL